VIFEVHNACFRYPQGKRVLSQISFVAKSGEIMSILGSNGAGKTTLLRCMLGLLKWERGETQLDGVPLRKLKYRDVWSKIGYVPQARLNAFTYTALEMALLGRSAHLGLFELPNNDDRQIAREALECVGIAHLQDKLCSRISGGELQMVLIARALATKPQMLILDEPESNLDFRNQATVLETIKNLKAVSGIGSIVNTHYPDHALTISDTALIMQQDGTGVYGAARDVISEPNLAKAFGIDVKIFEYQDDHHRHTCVMPVY
jgi:iron complex transport system ATP-binding protein